MPANKDAKNGTWTVQCYYTDWTGERKKKKKRGFETKKAALEWEREFLRRETADVNMSLESFAALYMEDMQHRLRETTYQQKQFMLTMKIIPYFGKKPLCEITPSDVRKWQNILLSDEHEYSQTYLRALNVQLSALFNYAVKYYNLKENPCHKAGSIGKKHANEMQIWTPEEYKKFRNAFKNKPRYYMAFQVLYYTGMRIGELMALTPADIDLDAQTITVCKSYTRLGKKDVIAPPKTPKSNRLITIPPFLCGELRAFMGQLYAIESDSRLFEFTKNSLEYEMKRGCKKSGVKKIRLHDLRHSHASLLIELGFSPLLIADRLGHEKVETTLNTYAHLYPNKQEEVSFRLEELK